MTLTRRGDVGPARRGRARRIQPALLARCWSARRAAADSDCCWFHCWLLLLLIAPLAVFQERKALVEHLRAGGLQQRQRADATTADLGEAEQRRARPIRPSFVCAARPPCRSERQKRGNRPALSAIRARENVNLKIATGLRTRGSARPQPLQDRRRGKAVRHEAAAGLEIAHRDAGLVAEPAVRLADVEAVAVEVLLQFQPLGAA